MIKHFSNSFCHATLIPYSNSYSSPMTVRNVNSCDNCTSHPTHSHTTPSHTFSLIYTHIVCNMWSHKHFLSKDVSWNCFVLLLIRDWGAGKRPCPPIQSRNECAVVVEDGCQRVIVTRNHYHHQFCESTADRWSMVIEYWSWPFLDLHGVFLKFQNTRIS